MSGGGNYGQSGGNMYGYGRTGATEGFGGTNALLTGNYPGSAPPLSGGQTGGNMYQPSPMDSAFAPVPPMQNPGFNPQGPWRGELSPDAASAGGNMAGTMGKIGGGVGMGLSPDAGFAGGNMGGAYTRTQTLGPQEGMAFPSGGQSGGNMLNYPQGGAMGKVGGGIGAPGSYGDYQNRRNAWIDQLRGYVMPPQSIGGATTNPVQGPVQGPVPTKQGIDHLANFKALLAEDPSGRLASEYRTRSGDTIGWWQNQMQQGAAPGLLGGDQQLLDFMRNTSPLTSNTSPLTTAEMVRLNQMAGIRGPSWLK